MSSKIGISTRASSSLSIADLPPDLFSTHILSKLDLVSLHTLVFRVHKRYKSLVECVRFVTVQESDICILDPSTDRLVNIVSKFIHADRIEFCENAGNAEEKMPQPFQLSQLQFFPSTITSLRIPDFQYSSNSRRKLKLSFKKETYFDKLLPLLKELWIDSLFMDQFFFDCPFLLDVHLWISHLPPTLEILRMKFIQALITGMNDDRRPRKDQVKRHPLEALPPGLKCLTTTMPRFTFQDLRYLTQLEQLYIQYSYHFFAETLGTEFHDLTKFLPSHPEFQVLDMTGLFFPKFVIPKIPPSVTDVTVNIHGATMQNHLGGASSAEHESQCYNFPPLKRLKVIGGAHCSHLFKFDSFVRLESYQHVTSSLGGYITSLPVGQLALVNPGVSDSKPEIFQFDCLPTNISHIGIDSSPPLLDLDAHKPATEVVIDFWASFDWASHFPHLVSLSTTIFMFIEDLKHLPQSLKHLEIGLSRLKYRPLSQHSPTTTIHLTPTHAIERVTQTSSYDNADEYPPWTWPPNLETLNVTLSRPSQEKYLPYDLYEPIPSFDPDYVLTDAQISDKEGLFSKSLPSSLHKLVIRNIAINHLSSFAFRLIMYLRNCNRMDKSESHDKTSSLPPIFQSASFKSELEFFERYMHKEMLASFDDNLLQCYIQYLEMFALPPHILVDLSQSYATIGAPPSHSKQKLVCLNYIKSISCHSPLPLTLHPIKANTRPIIPLNLSTPFLECLPEMRNLRNLNNLAQIIKGVPKPHNFAIKPTILPDSIETIAVSKLDMDHSVAEIPSSSKSQKGIHQGTSNMPRVLRNATVLRVQFDIGWSHAMTLSRDFCYLFQHLLHLHVPYIPMETLLLLKQIKSLEINDYRSWRDFDGWKMQVDENFEPIKNCDAGNPLPPTLTNLKAFVFLDIFLVNAPPGLKFVDIRIMRTGVLKQFQTSRDTDFSLALKVLSHPVSAQGDTQIPLFQKLLDDIAFSSGKPIIDQYDPPKSCVKSGGSKTEELIIEFGSYLASQLQYFCTSNTQQITLGKDTTILGNLITCIPTNIRHLSLHRLPIRYIKPLQDIKHLETLFVGIWVCYNAEDAALISEPVFISDVTLLCLRSSHPSLELVNSNQFISKDAVSPISALYDTHNFRERSPFALIVNSWFPNFQSIK